VSAALEAWLGLGLIRLGSWFYCATRALAFIHVL
jgi:hypothetical protein